MWTRLVIYSTIISVYNYSFTEAECIYPLYAVYSFTEAECIYPLYAVVSLRLSVSIVYSTCMCDCMLSKVALVFVCNIIYGVSCYIFMDKRTRSTPLFISRKRTLVHVLCVKTNLNARRRGEMQQYVVFSLGYWL